MTNVLERAINSDDGEIIQHVLDMRPITWRTIAFQNRGPKIESRARIVGDCCNRGAVSGLTST